MSDKSLLVDIGSLQKIGLESGSNVSFPIGDKTLILKLLDDGTLFINIMDLMIPIKKENKWRIIKGKMEVVDE